MQESKPILFEEKQRFTQWWLWLLLGGLFIFLLYGFLGQIVSGTSLSDSPAHTAISALVLIIISGILFLFYHIKLITEITDEEIRICYKPFNSKIVLWENIKSAEVVKYGFMGWGIRLSSKYGTVYSVKGDKGVAFELRNGDKFLIGTQSADELKKILSKALKR